MQLLPAPAAWRAANSCFAPDGRSGRRRATGGCLWVSFTATRPVAGAGPCGRGRLRGGGRGVRARWSGRHPQIPRPRPAKPRPVAHCIGAAYRLRAVGSDDCPWWRHAMPEPRGELAGRTAVVTGGSRDRRESPSHLPPAAPGLSTAATRRRCWRWPTPSHGREGRRTPSSPT
jgi:hypothetical protein